MDTAKPKVDLRRETMTVEKTRQFLGYGHRSTIYRLLDQGDLMGYRIGRRMGVRVYLASAEEFKRRVMDEGY